MKVPAVPAWLSSVLLVLGPQLNYEDPCRSPLNANTDVTSGWIHCHIHSSICSYLCQDGASSLLQGEAPSLLLLSLHLNRKHANPAATHSFICFWFKCCRGLLLLRCSEQPPSRVLAAVCINHSTLISLSSASAQTSPPAGPQASVPGPVTSNLHHRQVTSHQRCSKKHRRDKRMSLSCQTSLGLAFQSPKSKSVRVNQPRSATSPGQESKQEGRLDAVIKD